MKVTLRLTKDDKRALGYPDYSIVVEVPEEDISKYGMLKAVERQFTWSGYLRAEKYQILDYRGEEVVVCPKNE